jgi:hypothetical protein
MVGANCLFSRQICRRQTRGVHHIDEHTWCLTACRAIQDVEPLRVQTAGDPLSAQLSVDPQEAGEAAARIGQPVKQRPAYDSTVQFRHHQKVPPRPRLS